MCVVTFSTSPLITHSLSCYSSEVWMIFVCEALTAVTDHLIMVVSMISCSLLAPKGMLATLTSVVGGSYHAVGT